MNVQKTNTKQKSAAPLNRKKSASRFFIHRGGSLFTASLLCTALLFPQCANVKGIFTDGSDTNPPKEPDPSCAGAADGSGFHGGDGMTEDTPFLICTYAQLGMMGADLSAHYALGSNIDASASCGGDCSSPSGSGWTPVGGDNCDGMDDDDTCFQGKLYGRDYVISDLTVNITEDYGGLFGYTGEHAEIRSVGLSDVNVTAGESTGGLVGYNNGNISHSYVTGAVFGESFLGGLVGNSAGTISNSYATDSVSSTGGSFLGGLVGNSVGNISNSYSTGVISATLLASISGGLVGNSAGNISNSYSTGEVENTGGSGYILMGGFVGQSGGSISNSYATGVISGTGSSSSIGGLVGNNSGSFSGINYFADDEDSNGGSDGLGGGSCDAAVCMQAMGDTDTARAAWLADSLDETDDGGLNWDAELDAEGNAVWGNLNAAGFPCLKNMPAGAEACP